MMYPPPPPPFNLRISALPRAFIFVIKRLMVAFWDPAVGSLNEEESLLESGGVAAEAKAAILQIGQARAGPLLPNSGMEDGSPPFSPLPVPRQWFNEPQLRPVYQAAVAVGQAGKILTKPPLIQEKE